MTKTVVHTINARDNVMLEVIRDYFKVDPRRMLMQIQGALAQTEEILARKGIEYSNLKTGLVPNPKKREVGFVFDTTRIDDSWYGLPIHNKLMPLFSKESNHSVLVGDYLGENEHQERLFRELAENLNLAREVEYRHSTQFYFVYINNLTDRMVQKFHAGLSRYYPYVGCV
jgi:hypothetical protein